MTTNIYVLRLKNGNYYIGKTTNVERRYQEHLEGNGSAWTKKFKPFAIDKVIKNASPFDEDKTVKEYMLKYGINSVRGGSYNSVLLTDEQIRTIKRELWTVQENCCRCGRNSHWEKDCFAKTDIDGELIDYEEIWVCEYCDEEFDSEGMCEIHEKVCDKKPMKCNVCNKDFKDLYKCMTHNCKDVSNCCYRCGRDSHFVQDCYSKTHIKGYPI